jgi:hypothetical protein
MSKFIKSYFNTQQKKTNMKFYFNGHINQWSIHIIPVIDLYLESHSPIQHRRFMKDGATGLYLSISWLDRGYTFGISQTLK